MFNILNVGEVKPRGWMYKQMEKDLLEGFVGHLDDIVPELIKQDDIYGKDRLGKGFNPKNLGVVEPGVEGSLQLQWWNSETQSNWYDGLIRNAFLVDSEQYKDKVKCYVEHMLSLQDENGYLGIYAPDLRYQFDFEGGELWAQSTLFRALLGYYELTKKTEILQAVVDAVNVTMKAYKIGQSRPFRYEQTHGLTFCDTLESLYRLTGDEKYIDYAVWLYDNFCKEEVDEKDAQLGLLKKKDYLFMEHGVHTYEHLRALITAYYGTKEERYKEGLESYLEKLETYLSPSGGPIGDEWIRGRVADPSKTGYEYCSIQELLHSYAFLLHKSGELKWADKIEWLLFNAGQGARHPRESAIAYLKSDNSYSMMGEFQFKQKDSPHKAQVRYKYSPSHQDAAVCCVPNAGRIYPYFVQHMWMKTEKGLIKTLYGPNTLITTIKKTKVEIEEKTNYPFSGNVQFNIRVEKPSEFELVFRKPVWCKKVVVKCPNMDYIETTNQIRFYKKWDKETRLDLEFIYEVKKHKDHQGDNYFSFGPLVFALPLQEKEIIGKSYLKDSFHDFYYKLDQTLTDELLYKENVKHNEKVIYTPNKETYFGQSGIKMQITLYNRYTQETEEVMLVPMGETILRKVTFESII